MTNLEGRVILRERAVAAAGRASAPTSRCSRRWPTASAAPTRSGPTRRASSPSSAGPRPAGAADYAGIDYDRIRDEHGVFWPCPAPDHPGTPRTVRRPLRARPTAGPAASPSSTAGPRRSPATTTRVHLTTGRVLAQYQSGAQTRRVRELPDAGPFVELHPLLADRIGARDGDPVVVTTRRGELKAPARVVEHDPPGHGVRAVPLGRRQPVDQRRARPVQPDAGVQGVRVLGHSGVEVARRAERRALVTSSPGGRRAHGVGRRAGPGWPRPAWPRSWPRPRAESRCSATSPTRRTTGSCCPRCSRAPIDRGVTLRDAACAGRDRPAPRGPGRGDRPRGARGRARRRQPRALRRPGPRHRQHPDPAADPRAGPDGRPAAREGARVPQPRRLPPASTPRCPAPGARSWSAAGCSASRSPAR